MINTAGRQPLAADKTYPTANQVRLADRAQLLDWCKTLPEPGESALREDGYARVKRSDSEILELILGRLRETRPPLTRAGQTTAPTPNQEQETTA